MSDRLRKVHPLHQRFSCFLALGISVHQIVGAVAGIATQTAFRDLWRRLTFASLLTLPILILGGLMIRYITRLMKSEQERTRQLGEATDRQAYLLREIHHRVKNNLQTILSLIRLERLPNATKESLQFRILAMMKVHEEMYRTDRFDRVNLQVYLTKVVEGISASNQAQVDVVLDIAPVEISGERALMLGILVNELVSNSFKHAFGPRGTGRLTVSLVGVKPNGLRLVVEDDGPGYDVGAQLRHMGSRLIEAYASQLGGTLTIMTQDHVTAVVEFPGDNAAHPADPVTQAA